MVYPQGAESSNSSRTPQGMSLWFPDEPGGFGRSSKVGATLENNWGTWDRLGVPPNPVVPLSSIQTLVVMFLQLSHYASRGHLCSFCGPGLFGEPPTTGGRFLPGHAKLKWYSTPKYLVITAIPIK
jgi:hypothetical protein